MSKEKYAGVNSRVEWSVNKSCPQLHVMLDYPSEYRLLPECSRTRYQHCIVSVDQTHYH